MVLFRCKLLAGRSFSRTAVFQYSTAVLVGAFVCGKASFILCCIIRELRPCSACIEESGSSVQVQYLCLIDSCGRNHAVMSQVVCVFTRGSFACCCMSYSVEG